MVKVHHRLGTDFDVSLPLRTIAVVQLTIQINPDHQLDLMNPTKWLIEEGGIMGSLGHLLLVVY